MKLYKGLNLNGNALLNDENVMSAYRDNRMKLYLNIALNNRDILGLPFTIHGGYQGNIVAGEFYSLNIRELNNSILCPIQF